MKTKLKIFVLKYLTRIMHALGFYVEKLPNEKKLYNTLQDKDKAVQEYELNKVTSYLKTANNQLLYTKIIHTYVPNWQMSVKHTRFIGTGKGASSLDAFRKVKYNDEWLFEKIYFTRSKDLERIEWFYKEIFDKIKMKMNVAPIKKIVRGELITILYFQFIELSPVPKNSTQSVIIEVSKKLYSFSQQHAIQKTIERVPNTLKDYTLHFKYSRSIKKAEEKAAELMGGRQYLFDIQETVNKSPNVLTHGDIHQENVFDNDYLIDWDSVGAYPLGLDVGFLFFRFYFGQITIDYLIHRIETEYKSTIQVEDWTIFKINTLYFYYVFTIHYISEERGNKKQKHLLHEIKELYQKHVK